MTGLPAVALDSPRFDWMQATVRQDVDVVADVLASSLSCDVETGKGLLGYAFSRFVKRDGETLARVLFGGHNGGNPHVIATSAATDEVLPVVRAAWSGEHEVTRLDSAQDFAGETAFDDLRSIMLATAERSRLSVTEIESTVEGVRSRTVYLGSPSSRVRVRLYEKGQFQRQQGHTDAPAGWVRMEAQIRPSGRDARVAASELDATEAWGLSAWTRDLAALAMGLDVERVSMQQKREPDYARALMYLERQYSATLRKALQVEGSWDAVGRRLGVLPDPPRS